MQNPAVKSSYKRLALTFHPDKAIRHCRVVCSLPGGTVRSARAGDLDVRLRTEADWLFKRIGEARDTLADEVDRARCWKQLAKEAHRFGQGARLSHSFPFNF